MNFNKIASFSQNQVLQFFFLQKLHKKIHWCWNFMLLLNTRRTSIKGRDFFMISLLFLMFFYLFFVPPYSIKSSFFWLWPFNAEILKNFLHNFYISLLSALLWQKNIRIIKLNKVISILVSSFEVTKWLSSWKCKETKVTHFLKELIITLYIRKDLDRIHQ